MQMLKAKVEGIPNIKEGLEVNLLFMELLKNFDNEVKDVIKYSITEGYIARIGKILIWED